MGRKGNFVKKENDEGIFYTVDDIMRGYNDWDKLNNVYKDLRDVLGEPVFESNGNLVLVSGSHRKAGYGWEIYDIEQNLVLLEYLNNWEGYAHEPYNMPRPSTGGFTMTIGLTLRKTDKKLERRIERIFNKYPRNK